MATSAGAGSSAGGRRGSQLTTSQTRARAASGAWATPEHSPEAAPPRDASGKGLRGPGGPGEASSHSLLWGLVFPFTCPGQESSTFYWQSSFSLWPTCRRKDRSWAAWLHTPCSEVLSPQCSEEAARAAGQGGVGPGPRHLQKPDGQLSQAQGPACGGTPRLPAVDKAQLVPEPLHAQLTAQRPPLPAPLGHLRPGRGLGEADRAPGR